jgi:hypothetical protein
VPEGLYLTADQAIDLQKQIQENSGGIDGSGIEQTGRKNVTSS